MSSERLSHIVALRFTAKLEEGDDVPQPYKGDPKTHGLDKPRGGGFSIMQNLQKDLHEESYEEADEKKPKTGSIRPIIRQAMYWCGPDRTYRLTRSEQNGGDVSCPKCRESMELERFTRKEKLYRCPECGFKVPTGKITTQKIEIEIHPDGEVEVEVELDMTASKVAKRFIESLKERP